MYVELNRDLNIAHLWQEQPGDGVVQWVIIVLFYSKNPPLDVHADRVKRKVNTSGCITPNQFIEYINQIGAEWEMLYGDGKTSGPSLIMNKLLEELHIHARISH